MGKQRREFHNHDRPADRGDSTAPPDWMRWAMVAGIAILVVISYMNYQSAQELKKTVESRLSQIDQRLGQFGARLETMASAAPRPSGPDPNKVYTIKTENALAEGPPTAAVTIAEFSDFQ